MKVAYVSSYDAQAVKSWSGIPYYMSRSLMQSFGELNYVGPLPIRRSTELKLKLKKGLYKFLCGQQYLQDADQSVLMDIADQANQQLKTVDYDLVFSPVTYTIAYLETKRPIVFWADATFAGLVDYYPYHSNLCYENVLNGMRMEQSALDRCTLALFASDWAAATAIKNYRVNPAKVRVVPFGANVECDRTPEDIAAIVRAKPQNQCNLLFLGVNWHRKGGDLALEVARQLNQSGVKTQLTVIGCDPVSDQPLPDYVKPLGFVSKATAEGRQTIDQAFAEAHFLILPSRAECYGIVFCEAASFGVPSLARNTGGIPTIIRSGINGKLFVPENFVEECCSYIEYLFAHYSQYEMMALSSFSEYQSRLNWAVASKTVQQLLHQT
jgi:glycosyltransferase involved in cell wall biosynthesis